MNMKSNQETNRYGCVWCIFFTTTLPAPSLRASFHLVGWRLSPSSRCRACWPREKCPGAPPWRKGILRWPEPQRKSIHLENYWRQLGGVWVFCRCGLLKLHFAREWCGHHHFDHVFCRKPTGKKESESIGIHFSPAFLPKQSKRQGTPMAHKGSSKSGTSRATFGMQLSSPLPKHLAGISWLNDLDDHWIIIYHIC